MVAVTDTAAPVPLGSIPLRALYVGPYPNELKAIVEPLAGKITFSTTARVEDALFLSRNFDFDSVIVDQRDAALATRLIVPLLACFNNPVNLVVINSLNAAEAYKQIPGTARLVPVPVRANNVLRALGLASITAETDPPATHQSGPEDKPARQLPATPLPMAPRPQKAKPHTAKVTTGKSILGLPMWPIGLAASMVLAALLSAWLLVSRNADGMQLVASTTDTTSQAELQTLSERIRKTEVDKKRAADSLARNSEAIETLLASIRQLQSGSANPVDRYKQELLGISMAQRDIAKARAANLTIAQLRQRRDNGLIDQYEQRMGALRILKIDEDESVLLKRQREITSSEADHAARLVVLKALVDNLAGRRTALQKNVSPDLLPLIREAATLLKEKQRNRMELDAAQQKLELFQEKTRQIRRQASVVGSADLSYCVSFAGSTRTCQLG